jgi:hypothetical protein
MEEAEKESGPIYCPSQNLAVGVRLGVWDYVESGSIQ